MNLYTSVRRLLEEQMDQFDQKAKSQARDIAQETARFRLPMQCGGKEAMKMVDNLLVRLREEWEKQRLEKPEVFTEQDMMEKEEMIRSLEERVNELIVELHELKQDYDEKIKIYERFERGGFFDTVYPNPPSAYISE